MNYYIYILSNQKNGVLYVGVTNNLLRRIYEHKQETMEGFTQKYHIHNLVYKEGYKIGYKNSWLDQAQGRKKEFDF